jgi:hypothetical protein
VRFTLWHVVAARLEYKATMLAIRTLHRGQLSAWVGCASHYHPFCCTNAITFVQCTIS